MYKTRHNDRRYKYLNCIKYHTTMHDGLLNEILEQMHNNSTKQIIYWYAVYNYQTSHRLIGFKCSINY